MIPLASIGTAFVEVDGDYGPLKKGAKSGVGPAAKIAGAAIAAGIGVALKGAIDEARESKKAIAQSNAVIKSTGGVANVTATSLGNLANAISAKAGIDDEAVQSAGNLLLTFKDVRDEVGKNNDVFSQALPVIADMSAAMDQDLKSSTIQVGKALNDPIKGMTALTRVGVTFTQNQKDQVKALVESGDKMAAQKIILRELNTEFAGSAEAQADPFDQFRVAVDNLKETVGLQLLPVMGDAADILSDWMLQIQTGTGPIGRFGTKVAAVFEEVKSVVLPALDAVKTAFEDLTPTFQGLAVGAVGAFAIFALGGPVALGIAAVVAGAVLIKRNWETIGPIFDRVAANVTTAFGAVKTWVAGAIQTVVTALDLGGSNMSKFGQAVGNAVGIAKTALGALAVYWKFIFQSVVLPIVKRVLPGVQQIFQGVFRTIGGYIKVFSGLFTGDFRKMWEGIKQVFSGQLKTLGGIVRAATAPLRAAAAAAARGLWSGIKSVGGLIFDAGAWLMGKLGGGIKSFYGRQFGLGKAIVSKTVDGVKSLAGTLLNLGKWIIDQIKKGLSNIVPKIGRPKKPDLNPFGGGNPVGKLGNDKGGLGKVGALASSYGNAMTSGYRPGDPGWHGKNRARDFAGGDMMGFAKAVAAKFGGGLLELIHTPLGFGIKNGRQVPSSFFGSAVAADHYDHVHVAMRRGGKAGPTSGGASVVYGEGKKDEWWISQEGSPEKNTRWGIEALESVSGSRVALFRKGGKKKPKPKISPGERADKEAQRRFATLDFMNTTGRLTDRQELKKLKAIAGIKNLPAASKRDARQRIYEMQTGRKSSIRDLAEQGRMIGKDPVEQAQIQRDMAQRHLDEAKRAKDSQAVAQAQVELRQATFDLSAAQKTAAEEMASAIRQSGIENLDAGVALARLTKDTADDAAAYGAQLDFWTGELARLQRDGIADNQQGAAIAEAASNMLSARESIESLKATVDSLATDMKSVADELKANREFAASTHDLIQSQAYQVLQGILSAVDRGIGGQLAEGIRTGSQGGVQYS